MVCCRPTERWTNSLQSCSQLNLPQQSPIRFRWPYTNPTPKLVCYRTEPNNTQVLFIRFLKDLFTSCLLLLLFCSDDFVAYDDQCIPDYNDKVYEAVFSLDTCKMLCLDEQDFCCMSIEYNDVSTVCYVNSVWTALYPLHNPCNVFSVSYYERTNPSTDFFHLSTIVIIIIIMAAITTITVVVIIIIMAIMITIIYTLICFLNQLQSDCFRLRSINQSSHSTRRYHHWTSDESRYRRTDENWPTRYHYSG